MHFAFWSTHSTLELGIFSDHVEIAMMYHCVTFLLNFYKNNSIKIKTDIISEEIKLLSSYMHSLVEILCVLEEKIGLVSWQLPHNMHAMETFDIQPTCEFSLFSFKLSKLVTYFYYFWEAKSIWQKSKLLKQLFDALKTNSLTSMTVLKIFASLFPLQIWWKMKHKGNFKQWFNVLLVIFEGWQGYELKT